MTGRRKVIAAVVLWLALAFAVWNVIFDRLLVLAGRRYVYDAALRFRTSHQYLRIDDVMRPAVGHAVRVASVSAAAVALGGLLLIRLAAAQDAKRRTGSDSAP
jgi:hypothetical protein